MLEHTLCGRVVSQQLDDPRNVEGVGAVSVDDTTVTEVVDCLGKLSVLQIFVPPGLDVLRGGGCLKLGPEVLGNPVPVEVCAHA